MSCSAPGAAHPLSRAGSADVPAIAGLLADAFADYPWTGWIVPAADRPARLRALYELSVGLIGVPHGEVWVARCPADGRIVGAVVAVEDVPPEVWTEVGPREAALLGDRRRAAEAADAQLAAIRPDEPVRMIATLGVAMDHRRRGLAARLLGLVPSPAYLETSSPENVTLYQRLGFTVRAEVTIAGGGPTVWALARDEKAAGG